jgi:signal transduction histidine kinase
MREGCRRTLNREGYQVDVAADGEEGLEKVRSVRYDLYLLDVRMPKISGLELLSKIRSYDLDAVCIIITGYASIDVAIQAIKLGAYSFISKPFDTDALLLTVNQGLEKRRLTLEAKRLHAIEAQAAELTRAKAELEKVDRLKSEFMLTVAHELRAPVAALQGYLQIIIDGYVTPDKQRPMLERASKRTVELLEMIDDLLQLARIKGAPAPTRVEDVDLAQVLEATVGLLRGEAELHNIALETDIRARPHLLMNPDHARQIWTNLLSNGLKYTPPGGTVRVILETNGSMLIGRVEDTGIGIAPDDLSRIFQEFYRAENAKALQVRGTGLGLSIIKRIIETYGGTVGATSTVGKGSVFIFSMPLTGHRGDQPTPQP